MSKKSVKKVETQVEEITVTEQTTNCNAKKRKLVGAKARAFIAAQKALVVYGD